MRCRDRSGFNLLPDYRPTSATHSRRSGRGLVTAAARTRPSSRTFNEQDTTVPCKRLSGSAPICRVAVELVSMLCGFSFAFWSASRAREAWQSEPLMPAKMRETLVHGWARGTLRAQQ